MQNKPKYAHPIIAKEGWLFITILSVITILAYIFNIPKFILFISLILLIFTIQFFRDPSRNFPQNINEYSVLAPADGKVVFIGQETNPINNIPALKVSIFMNVFNVHSNRIPISGQVKNIKYFAGKFFNAALDKASAENERNAVVLSTNSGHDITFIQIAGLVARRILCYIHIGESVNAGQRYGFIRFGSRVDLYLPLKSEIHIQLGQKVSATSSLVASLPKELE